LRPKKGIQVIRSPFSAHRPFHRRPPPTQTGESFLELFEQKQYEKWAYTVNELQAEQAARGAGPPTPDPKKP
jgi:hypothetical protein